MFTQQLPVEVFHTQREFIRIFEANLDFTWWAKALIVEETKELEEAHLENFPMEDILKEIGDVVYVVAGFYNTMPVTAQELRGMTENLEIQDIFENACRVMSNVTEGRRIPIDIVIKAFMLVHESNMSKLDADGSVLRREDGKILKGPNYHKPDMSGLVKELADYHAKQIEDAVKGVTNASN